MSQTKLIVFDIDGTLSDAEWRAHHAREGDWDAFFDKCGDDKPIDAMVSVHNAIAQAIMDGEIDARIEYWTGRPERVRSATNEWLFEHLNTPCTSHLWMRNAGDYRADCVIKEEWLLRVGTENITMVFEDRKRVVSMYRSHGVRCLQVADGDY